MRKIDYPITSGVRFLQQKGIVFVPHLYSYVDGGGTAQAASSLHVDHHAVIKTLVMDSELRRPFLALMHGDREISTKQLARILKVKKVEPSAKALAEKVTGYQVGGISPFGSRIPLQVFVESSVMLLEEIYINGGKRGFLVEINPKDLAIAFALTLVDVAIQE
jgi:Cys-tRNA(Pro) deacylase